MSASDYPCFPNLVVPSQMGTALLLSQFNVTRLKPSQHRVPLPSLVLSSCSAHFLSIYEDTYMVVFPIFSALHSLHD